MKSRVTIDPLKALYKYVTYEILCHIVDGTIRFTQPSAFNDPFELLPAIAVPKKYKGIKRGEIELKIALDAERRSNHLGMLSEVPEDCEINDGFNRDIVRQLNKIIGILCLSKNGNSHLMWSHYSDSYSGAVIEFYGDHPFFFNKINVEYRKKRPIRSEEYYKSGGPIPISEFYTKDNCWSYEEEVRITKRLAVCRNIGRGSRNHDIYVHDIPISCIKSITLGQRMSIEQRCSIYEKIKDTNVELYIAAVDHAEYSFWTSKVKGDLPSSKSDPIVTVHSAEMFSKYDSPVGEEAREILKSHLHELTSKSV